MSLCGFTQGPKVSWPLDAWILGRQEHAWSDDKVRASRQKHWHPSVGRRALTVNFKASSYQSKRARGPVKDDTRTEAPQH